MKTKPSCPCLLGSTEIICISNVIRGANKQPPNTQKTGWDGMKWNELRCLPNTIALGPNTNEAVRHARILDLLLSSCEEEDPEVDQGSGNRRMGGSPDHFLRRCRQAHAIQRL